MTTPQDFDRLSAYLDHQLSAAEKAKLEKRLAREPELKSALADLRMTVRALRTLPTVKPPRNFTLSRAQAQALQRPGLTPVLRLATVFAALALVVVVAGDLLGSGFRNAAPAPPLAAEKSATLTESAASAGGEQTNADAQPSPAPAPTEAPVSAMAGISETSTSEAESTAFAFTAPLRLTETPETTARTLAAATQTPTPATQAVVESAPEMPSEAAPGLAPVRYVEIGLVVLTIMLALATWLCRRN